jgi:hypothetical protein
MFLIKKLTFDRMNFLKLSVHVFCLAEKAKLRRTNSRTNCQQNKITVCLPATVPPVIDVDSVGDSAFPVPAPVSILFPAEPFKLPPIADAKAYLNPSIIIQYYLCPPEFLTQRSDNALVTDLTNAEASAYWEGKIRVTVQDGSLPFLFENKGLMYDGKGFEMLAALNQHCCCPDSVANAFTTLMLLFNKNSMGK